MADTAVTEPKKAEKKKRVVPVLNNLLGKVQISAGNTEEGAFDGANLVMLEPGQNLIDETLWGKAKKQEQVKVLLKTKIRGTGSPEDAEARVGEYKLIAGEPIDAESPLDDLSEDEQLMFVDRTESLDLLRKLANQAQQPRVAASINKKIASIENEKAQLPPSRQ